MTTRCKLKSADIVQIQSGKDRGKRGKILKVVPQAGIVTIEGVNVFKKHQKPRSAQRPGEIIEKNMPLAIAKVQLVCPHCNQATRIEYKFGLTNVKSRTCKKCHQII